MTKKGEIEVTLVLKKRMTWLKQLPYLMTGTRQIMIQQEDQGVWHQIGDQLLKPFKEVTAGIMEIEIIAQILPIVT